MSEATKSPSIRKMEAIKSMKEANAREKAEVDIWQYVFGFTPMAVVKCAIELRIADALEAHGGAMSLPDLASAVACSAPALRRIMRYLIHRGFFELRAATGQYAQTPLSRLLLRGDDEARLNNNSLASFVLMESSPVMLAPWHALSSRASVGGGSAFEAAHGRDVWEFASRDPGHSKLINDAMASHARRAAGEILERYGEAFEGIGSLVDVGGGDGTALRSVVAARPGIRGINFDLPHVVAAAERVEGVEHVGGDMFKQVPKADAAFIMWVLHDWSDDECVQILRNCREAIPKETGKVIIAEAVIVDGEEDKYSDARLALDMVMMAHTDKGKERTIEEWDFVIKGAGFSRYTVKHIGSIFAVIEAYP
ncbi:acetylserotonin O-methyltransferase-like [Salvia miltiorrhiza]|uniref:acetylserotonin O-methyltransferase-like n=1 Tax=Salvia miltiorrhiza TaxID=226208 RepID=UPI0025AD6EAD|nr:acetylserotonin O-methyltransferase-like [Salvia miltiorrhiza]